MEDKASNLDAVLKEAVDLVRANSLILLSLSLHVLLAFSCSRGCFLGYRAVRGCPARRGAGALLLLLCFPSSWRACIPRSAEFSWCEADVWGFAVLVPCRLSLAVN
jgi:hypothetical protein